MIKLLRLITGEVIISLVKKENADSYSLSYPAFIGNNTLNVFLPETGGKCDLMKTAVLAIGDPEQGLSDLYNSMFGPSGSSDLTCTK